MASSVPSDPPGEGAVLAVTGELDLATAPRFERELLALEQRQPPRLVIDLSGVDFIDSTGLRVILGADLRARRAGRVLEVVRGPDHVHRLFGITGLVTRLTFVEPESAGH